MTKPPAPTNTQANWVLRLLLVPADQDLGDGHDMANTDGSMFWFVADGNSREILLRIADKVMKSHRAETEKMAKVMGWIREETTPEPQGH